MKYKAGQTLVLANVSFTEEKPYLLINGVEEHSQEAFFPLGKIFSLKKLEKRYCIGSFDLIEGTRQACPLSVELPADHKEEMCPACREATGFNPAFYNTPSISPQQRAYNNTPHYVYFAYFSPQHIKAGITAERRGAARLLEQGARAALIVGHFPTAEEARELEARLCASEGIYETMRASKKADLLCEVRYDFSEASKILLDVARDFGLEPMEQPRDLDKYYFEGTAPSPDSLQLPSSGSEDICGGRCVGMVGPLLVFEQEGIDYVVSLKEWESSSIELYQDEVIQAYDFEPMQMSLL